LRGEPGQHAAWSPIRAPVALSPGIRPPDGRSATGPGKTEGTPVRRLEHEISNYIALISSSYKLQTVVCSLYEKRCCLLPCLHKATAALWPRDRSPTRRGSQVCRNLAHPPHPEYMKPRPTRAADALDSAAPARRCSGCRTSRQVSGGCLEARPPLTRCISSRG
jgi:hypothetical protein